MGGKISFTEALPKTPWDSVFAVSGGLHQLHPAGHAGIRVPGHQLVMKKQGQGLQEDNILPFGSVALRQNRSFRRNGAAGLLHQLFHGAQRFPGADNIIHNYNPLSAQQADIVLIGVSRSSKTPLSIYLSQQGYKVANIPLDPSTEPPKEIYDVDRTRLFGLMTTADVLIDIRQRRLGRAQMIASRYADPEYVYEDLEKARALMRKLGCIIVHTEKRAVEETAQEILRYYERSHPSTTDIIE